MSNLSIEAALARIDRALSRIEQATALAEQSRAHLDQAYGKLDSRHDMLRNRIAETIARLDGLIAETPAAASPAATHAGQAH
jgi:ABC-type transporter Mla subunit MlaD